MRFGGSVVILAGVLITCAAASACAQTPAENRPPPEYGSSPTPAAAEPGAARAPTAAPPLTPPLLPADASRQTIIAWLQANVPASRGRLVYVNGAEAFWIEHQDIDPRDDLKVTATIQAENFADPDLGWRSSYEVTQFDCENQQQLHDYLTRYPGAALTGPPAREQQLIRHNDFVSPIALDFGHLRAACLVAYDQIRKRLYTIQMP